MLSSVPDTVLSKNLLSWSYQWEKRRISRNITVLTVHHLKLWRNVKIWKDIQWKDTLITFNDITTLYDILNLGYSMLEYRQFNDYIIIKRTTKPLVWVDEDRYFIIIFITWFIYILVSGKINVYLIIIYIYSQINNAFVIFEIKQ